MTLLDHRAGPGAPAPAVDHAVDHAVDGEHGSDSWPVRIGAVLADESLLRLLFQPVVELTAGTVAGYEALARFGEPDGTPSRDTPDVWFAAATALGLGPDLESIAVRRCLDLRRTLPANRFLTVNVSPRHLTHPLVSGPLLTAGDLAPLVVELTEHHEVQDLRPLVALRDELRDRGALLAVDDAGSGYSGLQQLSRFRPHLIKLDRALVEGADRDPVRLALAEALGEFGDRIDAWLLAEGVETWAELEAFARIGVPLAQGFLLGRPAPAWAELDPVVAARLRTGSHRLSLVENVGSLTTSAPVAGRDAVAADATGVRVDATGRPTALLLPARSPDGHRTHRPVPVTLRVPPSAEVTDVARRVVTRAPEHRYDPVAVVDDVGALLGIVGVDQLLLRLATPASLAPRPVHRPEPRPGGTL